MPPGFLQQPHHRRHFVSACGAGLFQLALGSLLRQDGHALSEAAGLNPARPLQAYPPHFAARAKHVIFLFMIGGPSQLDLFDPKPALQQREGEPIPESFIKNAKFAQIKEKQPKLWGTRWKFAQHGQCGAPVSTLLPHTAAIVDRVAFLKAMRADDVNHAFAELQMNTGWRQFGRPSIGSWVLYGLGTACSDLPGFVVLSSGMAPRSKSANYGTGFLPSSFQGVPLRAQGDPILNLSSPPEFDAHDQQRTIETINGLNQLHLADTGDPEIATRIASYELAFRMQASAPSLLDLAGESHATLDLYGAHPAKPSFARNCLIARRLVERGVRFVQVFHGDWDHHSAIEKGLPNLCRDVDRASAALVQDLDSRGLLDETLVIWGGEFGRGPVAQVEKDKNVGRDHHIDAFTLWLAGGGVKPGITIGGTDELGYFATHGSAHIHDLHATVLHLLGMNHERLTYRFSGRDFRLTDVAGHVIEPLLV